jgi:hypothetical protein
MTGKFLSALSAECEVILTSTRALSGFVGFELATLRKPGGI